jgi:hypothetical protein
MEDYPSFSMERADMSWSWDEMGQHRHLSLKTECLEVSTIRGNY